jgi:hypothetical protein
MIKRKIIVSQLLYCPLIIVWFQQIILLSIDYCFISTYGYLDIFLNYQKSDPQLKSRLELEIWNSYAHWNVN